MKRRKSTKRYLIQIYILLSVIGLMLLAVFLMLPSRGERELPPEDRAVEKTEKRTYNTKSTEKGPSGKDKKDEKIREKITREKLKRTQEYELILILDDVGNNPDDFLPFMDFPGEITFSILPELPYSRYASEEIREAGKTVMLHLPMEALGGTNPGPGAVYSYHSKQEIEEILERDLKSVPGAVGVNNHQGSKITKDPEKMRVILSYLHKKGLAFIDSRTTKDSVAASIAREIGITFAERRVFLDNEPNYEAIRSRVLEAVELAEQEGTVIMIGHVTVPELAEVLEDMYEELRSRGIEFKSIKSIIEEKSG